MKVETQDRIVVTGATGFLGSHLLPVLEKHYPQAELVPLSSADYDLMHPENVEKMLADHDPAVVIHLAAFSGGIEANRTRPADYFHTNLVLMTHMFDACARRGIGRLVYPMGGCSYPGDATSPIDESQMWNGYPVPSSVGYAMAKKMGIVAGEVYGRQYGLNSVVLVPGNMYGEHDNFRLAESHVIPGMIRRFHEAVLEKADTVTLWGSGEPVRDFVYAGDVARTFPFFIEHDDITGPVNISTGTTTRIRDLAALVSELTGFGGRIAWDTSKPDGQCVKIFDVAKFHELDLGCNTTLRDGLAQTIRWFADQYHVPGAVRL